MKAFFSHSSADKDLVLAVYEKLKPQSTWLDRAEIEWGQSFIEKIEEGIKTASDFVLFWSTSSAKSAWVNLELNMAFIRMLEQRAIRIKVIRLDETELPLRLKPFHYLSVVVSVNPIDCIVSELQKTLTQPTSGIRHKFLNRSSELERIEEMINDPETKIVLLHGFQGIGKASLAKEALRRFFEGATAIEIAVHPGMGPAELALQLYHEAFGEIRPQTSKTETLAAIEQAMEAIINRGQFIVFRDSQHWLDDKRDIEEPLTTIIRQAADIRQISYNPVFITSTRRPIIPSDFSTQVSLISVRGLCDKHVAALISLWHKLSEGLELDPDVAAKVAPQVHGHPVAAKLVANLVAQYGGNYLLEYPSELIALRRDLAKRLIRDLELKKSTTKLMEVLAIIGSPVPSSVLMKALGFDSDDYHNAVMEATVTGIAEVVDLSSLAIHPLIADYFWRSHWHYDDYKKKAETVADVVYDYSRTLPIDSSVFVALLPSIFRLYALAGNLTKAREIRRDLTGELASAAITHYNRRQYALAESFIGHVLEEDPQNWRMRQYLARIHVRKERWGDADQLIEDLLAEQPGNVGTRHLRGWRLLRAKNYEGALQILTQILVDREDHVASLRDAADCLYRLNRPTDALSFLQQAKQVESDNPYTLDLEARIYEKIGDFANALAAAEGAVNRDPKQWSFHHRLARIFNVLGRRNDAIEEARKAVGLDPAQFVALSTLISFLIEVREQHEDIQSHIDRLYQIATNQKEKGIATHMEGRFLHMRGNTSEALALVNKQIRNRANLAANYGLLADIRLTQYKAVNPSSASAQLYLQQAKNAIKNCETQRDHDRNIVDALKERVQDIEDQMNME